MNRSRVGWLVVGTLMAIGCAGPIYELQPVPRAGDGTPPVKAQVRRVSWLAQPESGGLAEGAQVQGQIGIHGRQDESARRRGQRSRGAPAPGPLFELRHVLAPETQR